MSAQQQSKLKGYQQAQQKVFEDIEVQFGRLISGIAAKRLMEGEHRDAGVVKVSTTVNEELLLKANFKNL